MTLRLLVVRHAQTDGNAEGRSQGRRDVPLNDYGRRQAAAVGERLGTRRVVAVYASPLSRSLATAEAIAAPHGLAVQVDDRLAELDHGILDGMTSEEMRRDYADVLARWRDEDPTDLVMPGGESMRDAQGRMAAAIDEIMARWTEGDVVVVTHNLAARAFLCLAMGIPMAAFHHFRMDLAAYSEVERLDDGGWLVIRLNDQCHVAELVSGGL